MGPLGPCFFCQEKRDVLGFRVLGPLGPTRKTFGAKQDVLGFEFPCIRIPLDLNSLVFEFPLVNELLNAEC